ncbi:MAG: hypothetical protein WCT19_02310 [Candidatus Paceibacterota bacterium]
MDQDKFVSLFNKNFFKFLFGFIVILAISFIILFYVGYLQLKNDDSKIKIDPSEFQAETS